MYRVPKRSRRGRSPGVERIPSWVARLWVPVLTALLTSSTAGALETITLRDGVDRYDVGPYLEAVEDRDRAWTIDDVAGPQFAVGWEVCPSLGRAERRIHSPQQDTLFLSDFHEDSAPTGG